jgi:hypothetical protein
VEIQNEGTELVKYVDGIKELKRERERDKFLRFLLP